MYHAFISYSHRNDARLAPVLQRALERLGSPWWRRSSVRVFRDDASLAASPALWPGIESALQKCEHLILLASPAAADSYWVDREVAWWLAHRSADRLLLVVTRGEIVYDRHAPDFDWQRTDCLPPALRGVFRTEPHWTDLRFANAPKDLSVRHSRFRSAALAVAAAIRGVAKDELERADLVQHRRSVALAAGGASAIGVLALATAVAIRIADQESASARSNRLESESRRLAAEALAHVDGGRGNAAATLKAAIAWRLAPTDEARRALRRIDESSPDVARLLGQHTSGARKVAFSPDGRSVFTVGDEGMVLQWSIEDGRPVGTPMASERQWVRQIAFSRDGSHLLLRGVRNDPVRTPALWVFRLTGGSGFSIPAASLEVLRSADKRLTLTHAALSPSGDRIAASSAAGVLVIEAESGASRLYRAPDHGEVTAVQFADASKLLFVSGRLHQNVRAGRIDLRTGAITLGSPKPGGPGPADFAAFSDDARRVAIWQDSRGLALWQIDPDLALRPLSLPEPRPHLSELTGHHAPAIGNADRVAVGVGGLMTVWDARSSRLLKSHKFDDSHGPALALSSDGNMVAALDHATPIIWRLDGSETEYKIAATRCVLPGKEDECIRRLCELLTVGSDPKSWRKVLGDADGTLMASLADTSCAVPTGGRSR